MKVATAIPSQNPKHKLQLKSSARTGDLALRKTLGRAKILPYFSKHTKPRELNV